MTDTGKALEIVKEINNNDSIDLSIPLLDGFELQEIDHPNVIFIATNKDHFMEQFIKDSILKEDEDYESHLKNVIKDTKEEMKKNNFLLPEKNLLFYKDINKYKVYVQNNILNNIIVKQMNAYILDSNNMFYQITISTPPISLEEKMTVTQDNNLNNSLFEMLKEVVTNIKEN